MMTDKEIDPIRVAQALEKLRSSGDFSLGVLPNGTIRVRYKSDAVANAVKTLGVSNESFWQTARKLFPRFANIVAHRVHGGQPKSPEQSDKDLADVFDLKDIETKYKLVLLANAQVYLGGEVLSEERRFEDGSTAKTVLLNIGHADDSGNYSALALALTESDVVELRRRLEEAMAFFK